MKLGFLTANSRKRPARQESESHKGLFYRILMLGGIVMLVSQIFISWMALKDFETELKPVLSQKAVAVGRSITAELKYAINELGIAADQLVAVDEHFDDILNSNTDIEYLALIDASSNILFESNLPDSLIDRFDENTFFTDQSGQFHTTREIGEYVDSTFPIQSGAETIASLHVGISGDNVRKQLSSVFYEIVSVIVVSMVLTLEFMMLFMSIRILGPTHHLHTVLESGSRGKFPNRVLLKARNEIGLMVSSLNRLLYKFEQRYQDFQFELRELRDAQIDSQISNKIARLKFLADNRYGFTDQFKVIENTPALIRIPFFLFIFSEELSRSFFPLFVSGFISLEPAFSYEVMIGLPITLFMAATFAATIYSGRLSYRLGSSRLFLVGITFAFIGYVGTFLCQSYIELILWRSLNGIGYGLIFNACETWVAMHSKTYNRALSGSAFVGAVFAGFVCGPPMGGMFADYVGPQMTFLISAGLAVISGYAAYRLLRVSEQNPSGRENPAESLGTFGIRPWRILFTNARFIAITFTAVPTKITFSAFLFFIIPLYLDDLGHTKTEIGQMLMLYGAVVLLGTPFVSRLADSLRKYTKFLYLGVSVSGIGLLFSLSGPVLGSETQAVLITVLALGIGHALIFSPQFAIMQEIISEHQNEIEVSVSISIYRFVDRIGLIVGPMLAAVLVQNMPYPRAIASIGVLVLLSMALSMAAMKIHDRLYRERLWHG